MFTQISSRHVRTDLSVVVWLIFLILFFFSFCLCLQLLLLLDNLNNFRIIPKYFCLSVRLKFGPDLRKFIYGMSVFFFSSCSTADSISWAWYLVLCGVLKIKTLPKVYFPSEAVNIPQWWPLFWDIHEELLHLYKHNINQLEWQLNESKLSENLTTSLKKKIKML